MEALFSGLVVAAVTGITILAYKHPEAYKKLSLVPTVSKICIAFFIILLIWQQAVSKTYTNLLPFIKSDAAKEAQKVVDSFTVSVSAYLIIAAIVFIVVLYLTFLSFLPELLKKEGKKEK